MIKDKKNIILETIDKNYNVTLVCKLNNIYAVFYENNPVTIKNENKLIDTVKSNSKKFFFQRKKNAEKLAEKLNKMFNTDKFIVKKIF